MNCVDLVQSRSTGVLVFLRISDPFLREASMSAIVRFLNDSGGATAIEYCLLAAGIAMAIIATVNALGPTLNATYTNINTQLR